MIRHSDSIVPPREIAAADLDAILALNAASETETSPLDLARLTSLLGKAFAATAIGDPAEAFLVAFDQDAGYDNLNFLWFRRRYRRFVYVDRIVTGEASRGRGHARALYENLFARARRAGHDLIACEVNITPPNPASDAFHAALGFEQVGSGDLAGGKVVRYLVKPLTRA